MTAAEVLAAHIVELQRIKDAIKTPKFAEIDFFIRVVDNDPTIVVKLKPKIEFFHVEMGVGTYEGIESGAHDAGHQ